MDDNEEYDRLVALEKSSGEIFSRTNSENWAVNANVHYNKWADFTLSDFKPVVESFTDLYSVFKCDKCEGLLHVNVNANKVEAVRCNCNSFNWNLKGK
nr:hypothetical protein [Methanobacterium formicicum]